MAEFGRHPRVEELRFLKRELFQAVYALLLSDPALVACYIHGTVRKCHDGVRRCFFIRFFAQSADYMEKVLYACIRQQALCPCALCLVEKADIYKMGMASDMKNHEKKRRIDDESRQNRVEHARHTIFHKGKGTESKYVDNTLKERSETPIRVCISISFRFVDLTLSLECLFYFLG